MSRRARAPLMGRAFSRGLRALTRLAVRTAKTARVVARSPPDLASGMAGGLRYRLFVPPGTKTGEPLPLLVMLHGCGQDAQALAQSTRMNQIASRERFLVLYPEQSRRLNLQGCWNWFQTRSGAAQSEADSIFIAIRQICRTHAVNQDRIALAGFSAGAGMAALLATRYPQWFRALAMHSGVAPGLAHSTASALRAMRGLGDAQPLAGRAGGQPLPALLVIQGMSDAVVAPTNGARAAQLWADSQGATPAPARSVQRGARYRSRNTSFFSHGRLVSTLCEIDGLGHAWSGGCAKHAYSEPKGPDASRMVWTFAAKQFALSRLEATRQHQYQQDDQDQAEPATWPITPAAAV